MGYLQKYAVLEEHWDTRETPDAKRLRDRRARMLRRQGWTVQIDTKKYSVLDVYAVYWLFAKRKKVLEK